MPGVDDLLRATARAEKRHFCARGFRWFVQPLIPRGSEREGPADHPRLRMRHGREPGPVRALRRLIRFRPFRGRTLPRARELRPETARPGRRHRRAVPRRRFRSGDVVRRAVLARAARRTAASRKCTACPALAGACSSTSRRWMCCVATIAILSHEIRRYDASDSRRGSRPRGFASRRMTYTTRPFSRRMSLAIADAASVARAAERRCRETGNQRFPSNR